MSTSLNTSLITTAAYCLHSRPYRENSVIVQLFTENTGRISALARSARSPKSKKSGITMALLQPFSQIQISYTGKSELKTLTTVENRCRPLSLQGQSLFAGMYMNELLIRLLVGHMEYPDIFQQYQMTLTRLEHSHQLEEPLRWFERRLLDSLGYGIPFVEVDTSGHLLGALQNNCDYYFIPESGFIRCLPQQITHASTIVFRGEDLIKMEHEDFSDSQIAQKTKQLMRLALSPLLGDKPLNSRTLFI